MGRLGEPYHSGPSERRSIARILLFVRSVLFIPHILRIR